MQTTLLGIAIALILALLTALVGPLFGDWTQYRPRFEAEASRLVGLPVRVGGGIDVRLLPTPTLLLSGVEIGARGESARPESGRRSGPKPPRGLAPQARRISPARLPARSFSDDKSTIAPAMMT